MKKLFLIILSLLMLLPLCACSPNVTEGDLAGKTFCFEGEGFGGDFTIALYADGTMSYYEGGLSSYIAMGTWTLEDGVVTLSDEVYPYCNHFLVEDGELIFRESDSTNFMYFQLTDCARFYVMEQSES